MPKKRDVARELRSLRKEVKQLKKDHSGVNLHFSLFKKVFELRPLLHSAMWVLPLILLLYYVIQSSGVSAEGSSEFVLSISGAGIIIFLALYLVVILTYYNLQLRRLR